MTPGLSGGPEHNPESGPLIISYCTNDSICVCKAQPSPESSELIWVARRRPNGQGPASRECAALGGWGTTTGGLSWQSRKESVLLLTDWTDSLFRLHGRTCPWMHPAGPSRATHQKRIFIFPFIGQPRPTDYLRPASSLCSFYHVLKY